MKYKYQCELCEYTNIYAHNFEKHLNHIHGISIQDYYQKYGVLGKDYVICPFCGVIKRNLNNHLTLYHKEEYRIYKEEHPDFLPYIESYSKKMGDTANKRWIPSDIDFIKTSLEEGKDLSLSINNPDYSVYSTDELRKWARNRVFSSRRSMKNLTNWQNEMYEYNKKFYRSKYEVEVAQQLDKYNIIFQYEDKIFPYFLNNKLHIDITDFYIPNAKLILEIKDDEFRNYISYRYNSLDRLIAMKNAVLKAGYNYALIDSQSSLTYLLMAYKLIPFDEEFLENEIDY